MGRSLPTTSSQILTKRQRRKTFKVQPDTQAPLHLVGSVDTLANELEVSEQLSTSRSFRNGAAQNSVSSKQLSSAGYPISLHSARMLSQTPIKQAAATSTVQAMVVQPSLGLAAPSTGWLSDSVKVADRVLSLLNKYGALQVSHDLHTLGYPELVAHYACLEVHLMTKQVDVDSCVSWIKRQPDLNSLNRPMNPLELLKYEDLSQAISNLLQRVPSINQQTAQIAIQQTLGDEDAAAAFLNAAMSKSHMPSSGDPNTMASLLLQNLPPGFNLPANSGEVVQAMAAAMAKASELQLATDRLAVAAIQSQQQIKAAMVSGQLSPVPALPQQPQPQEASPQLTAIGSASDSWQKEREEMAETVEVLEKHKDWADKKIGQLIKRVTEAERPQKDEAYRLRDEVHKLRQEKDILEGKLKEFERSLQKLKDCTYQEATQKREYERQVQAVQADLRGANLREQELQHHVEHEASSAKTERKKRETAERLCRQAVEDKASISGILSEHGQKVAELQAAAKRQERLADERLMRAEQQIASMAQARREMDNKCEILAAEKASMASGMEAKDAQMENMQQEHSSVQTQLLLCQDSVSQLQSELMQAQQALAGKDQQTSFYSHWNGGILFDGNSDSRSPVSTSPSTPLAIHPNPPASVNSSQEGVRSPVRQLDRSQTNLHAPQAKLQNALSSVLDSFRSPTQNRQSQMDQPTSVIQCRLEGRSSLHHASPNAQRGFGQSPIGSHMVHRKSNSMDSSAVQPPEPLTGFSRTTTRTDSANGNSNKGGKRSPGSHHAQHAAAIPSSDGPIASLLGLNAPNGLRVESHVGLNSSSSCRGDRSLRNVKPGKSLQSGGARGNQNAGMNAHDAVCPVPHAMPEMANGHGDGVSWMQPAPNAADRMNHANQHGLNNSEGSSQHAEALQRQLHISMGN